MIGSTLVSEYVPAYEGNHYAGRDGNKIKKITVHHMAARLTAYRCGELFQNPKRGASSHYGIGYNGEIAQYVSEKDGAWTDSDRVSNKTSVTIECSNDKAQDPWTVSEATISSLIRLIADISLRNALGLLVKGVTLTWHQMYAATTCPGPYLLSKMDYICEEANKIILKGAEINMIPVSCVYQVHTSKWLPNVTGHDLSDSKNGYAGNTGQPISAVFANPSKGNLFYKVRELGGKWLPEVKNREDYAGNLGKPIDSFMIRSDITTVSYQVHTVESGWLPSVTGYDETDYINGFAGNRGEAIDAIMIRLDPIASVEELPLESPAPEEPPTERTETPSGDTFDTPSEDPPSSKWGKIVDAIIKFLEWFLSLLKGEK